MEKNQSPEIKQEMEYKEENLDEHSIVKAKEEIIDDDFLDSPSLIKLEDIEIKDEDEKNRIKPKDEIMDEDFLDSPDFIKPEEVIIKEDAEQNRNKPIVDEEYLDSPSLIDHEELRSVTVVCECSSSSVATKTSTIIRTCEDVVDHLLKNKFSRLSYADQLFVKGLKVPQPDLSITLTDQASKQSRCFQNTWYAKYPWLTGSPTLNKLFCWPCVLFSNRPKEVWATCGYDNLKNLSRATESHAKTQEHLSCVCKLHLFGKQDIINNIDSTRQIDVEKHNNTVRKNRGGLKRLINVCVFVCNQDAAFHERDEDSEDNNFKEIVSFVAKNDSVLTEFIHSNSAFLGNYETVQNELIDSIVRVLKQNIDREISKAPFFSWQVDDFSDLSKEVSVIARYVRSGKVVERFLGFYDYLKTTSEDFFRVLNGAFSKFDLKNKLIAQAYDGATLEGEQLNSLQVKIKSVAPQALFTHSYDHSLDTILSDGCRSIKPVRIFFAGLWGFSDYFSEPSKRTDVLDTLCGNRLLSDPARWRLTSPVLTTVHTYRTQLYEALELILESPNFDEVSLSRADQLRYELEDSDFLFFLETFHLIFQLTDPVFAIIQSKFTDVSYSKGLLQVLISKLRDLINESHHFDKIFANFSADDQPESKRRKISDSADPRTRFKHIFHEIIDSVCYQIKLRFMDTFKLDFFDLVKVDNFQNYSKVFHQELLDSLLTQYPFFDAVQLKNELSVLYCDKILGNSNTPLKMLEYMCKCELNVCMPELYKLLCLILTIPFTSVSGDSCLKRLKTFTRNRGDIDGFVSNLSMVAINNDLVRELTQHEQFYDDIIDYFSDHKDPKIPLKYKSA